MSTVFLWKNGDVQALLESCETDGIFPLITKYASKGSTILDSGCGLARYVRYLHDRGWKVTGLEYSNETVATVNTVWPDLRVIQGDCSHSPFADATFDVVLSLGVVEHFVEGPGQPLKDIYRILRQGGVAIVTVPCLNRVRQVKRRIWWYEVAEFPRALVGKFFKGRRKSLNRVRAGFRYMVYPAYGDFFEYWMTTGDFLKEVQAVGFDLVEHVPHAVLDGLYHELNPFRLFVKYSNWKFDVSSLGRWLNSLLANRPFFHCHMQAVVVRKP